MSEIKECPNCGKKMIKWEEEVIGQPLSFIPPIIYIFKCLCGHKEPYIYKELNRFEKLWNEANK